MKAIIFAMILVASIAALPLLFDQNGDFRPTATPTPLEVMEGIPGNLIDGEPRQIALPAGEKFTLEKNDYRLFAVDKFSLEGVVLGRRDYSVGRESDLSPMDLAIGWGIMSDPVNLKRISISQSNRFYHYRIEEGALGLRPAEVGFKSSNMHMIPRSEDVAKNLEGVRQGEIVRIEGHLVNVKAPDGWEWLTSRSRVDTGRGACEIILVSDIEVRTFGKG